jgi:hypothetical protein
MEDVKQLMKEALNVQFYVEKEIKCKQSSNLTTIQNTN